MDKIARYLEITGFVKPPVKPVGKAIGYFRNHRTPKNPEKKTTHHGIDAIVLNERRLNKDMIVRTEIWQMGTPEENPPAKIKAVYNNNFDYVGDIKIAKQLAKLGIAPEKRSPDSNVCSIGYSKRRKKWYGWSHRAIQGFKVGDVVKEGDIVTETGWTPEYLAEHPEDDTRIPAGFVAKTPEDARKLADAFAESVASEDMTASADLSYEEFKAAIAEIEKEMLANGKIMKDMGAGSGKMGLTPESIRADPKYKKLKARNDSLFQQMRNLNAKYAKKYKKEAQADRAKKRATV